LQWSVILKELKCRLWFVAGWLNRVMFCGWNRYIKLLVNLHSHSLSLSDSWSGQRTKARWPSSAQRTNKLTTHPFGKAACIRPNRASFWALKLIHGHARIIARMTRFFMATWRLWARILRCERVTKRTTRTSTGYVYATVAAVLLVSQIDCSRCKFQFSTP